MKQIQGAIRLKGNSQETENGPCKLKTGSLKLNITTTSNNGNTQVGRVTEFPESRIKLFF